MDPQARIYVAGHRGLAGSALTRRLQASGYMNLVLRTHAELELTDRAQVDAFFKAERPDYVFLAAARVGGIHANATYPGEFLFANTSIQTSVLDAAWRHSAKRVLFLGSSCIYPRDCPQPIREDYLLTGPLESTNRAYAIAKIAGVEMCRAYNQQYGTRFLAAMPTNLYGPGDSYDPMNSHVLPALIRKAHEAKQAGADHMVVWGTGKPRRELLHCDDMAAACVFLMEQDDRAFDALLGDPNAPALINVGCGEDATIAELAAAVCRISGFKGRLVFDSSKPDGTPRKILDVTRLFALGWKPAIALEDGLRSTYEDYKRTLLTQQRITA
jgi:GDP-L-fucose synthase